MKHSKHLTTAAILFGLIFFQTSIAHSRATKVLFIGNSLTSANNLPRVLAFIAKSKGSHIAYDSFTPGGARLAHHASNPIALRKIVKTSWDYVVLQEQSQYTGFNKQQLIKDVFPFAKRLAKYIKSAGSRVKVVFYMTMARRNGDPDNENVSPELSTYEGTQNRINQNYLEMGQMNESLIAPVGEVWKFIRKDKPDLNLYKDDIHPNIIGTYLAACVFYSTIFREPVSGSSIPKGINHKTAKYIHKVVDRIVYEQSLDWDWTQ